MAAYDKVKQILAEAATDGEELTTLGEIELPTGRYDPGLIVRLVVKGENGEPVIMTGELMAWNNGFREALVHIGGGFSEFSFDCPALLVSISSEVEAA